MIVATVHIPTKEFFIYDIFVQPSNNLNPPYPYIYDILLGQPIDQ